MVHLQAIMGISVAVVTREVSNSQGFQFRDMFLFWSAVSY